MDPRPAPIGRSAGQVCRELGLAPSTLRAWNRRYGIGPGGHQAGRHRLYEPADVAALARMRSLIAAGTPTAVAAAIVARGLARPPEQAGLPRTARGLRTAVLRMETSAVQAGLRDAVTRNGPLHVWNRLYRPVMAEIGRRVAEQGNCLEAERLLSWATVAALHLVAVPDGSGAPRVILACVPGERHTVGLEVLRAVLAEHEVPVTMLGSDTPAAGLAAAVAAVADPVVVLAAQTPRTARPARLTAVRRAGAAAVVAAGPGWEGAALPSGTVRARSVEQAVEVVADTST